MAVSINGEKASRVASTVAFPYTDISDGIAVAEGVLKGGGLPLSRDQLATAIGNAPGGGGFATKVATAKTFGLIDSQGGKYVLTDLGHEIVDPIRRTDAMTQAFLAVDLYRKIYDEFRGKRLPPRPHGLEAAFVSFGVSPKNVKPARLAFDKSARMAGFFHNGDEDRLVMPFGTPSAPSEPPERGERDSVTEVATTAHVVPARAFAGGSGAHPLIEGMIAELPAPKSEWSKADQSVWLDTLAGLFRVVYKSPKDSGEIKIIFTPGAPA
jgi:hypothetical protein